MLCTSCNFSFHFYCVGLNDRNYKKLSAIVKSKYKCPDCKLNNPQSANTDVIGSEKTLNSTNKIIDNKNQELAELKDYFDGKFQHLEKKMDTMMENIRSEFNKRVETLEIKVKERDEVIEDLEARLDELEVRSRICNIEIRGIPETRGEDVAAVVKRVGEIIGCGEIREGDIQVAHRVMTKRSDLKPIVVQLGSRFLRNKWIAAYKQCKVARQYRPLLASELNTVLNQTPVFIHEHITVRRKMLLAETREFAKQVNIKYVWIRDGAIFVREEEKAKVHKVTTARQLAEVKLVFNSKVPRNPNPDINA